MPRTLDGEPALYPPDVQHPSHEEREQRNRAIVGTTLVALGFGYILKQAVGHDISFVWLSIGLGLLAGWTRVPQFKTFAFGSIISGFGAMGLFRSLVGEWPFASTVGALIIAAGFFAVYARYPKTSWSGGFAALYCVIAAIAFANRLLDMVSTSVDLMPLSLVSAGALLLLRDKLPGWFVKTGLVLSMMVFSIAAVTNIGDGDDKPAKTTVTTTSKSSTRTEPRPTTTIGELTTTTASTTA